MQIKVFPTIFLKSNMYLIAENRRGILIDAMFDAYVCDVIEKIVDGIDYLILTHEHCDHIRGANELRARYGCPILCGEVCAEKIVDSTKNFSRYFEAYARLQEGESLPDDMPSMEPFTVKADQAFSKDGEIFWEGHRFLLKETPGHSPGSCCILMDGKILFSGDTLLPSGKAMTRFPGGSRKQYELIALPYLKSLLKDTLVYPGHYESFRLGDTLDLK